MSALDNRVAIITGGASGLGEAIAHRFASEGATVVIADIDSAGAERVAKEIGDRAHAITTDVTRSHSVNDVVAAAAQLGPIRVLVLSAVVESMQSVENATDEDWQKVIDVDLKGPFLCMRASIPHMVEAGGGSVIAMGSTLGLLTSPGYAAYCAAKGALTNLCKQAAIEHAPEGVRVNVLAPSATEVGLFKKVSGLAPDPEAVRQKIAASSPMKRLGTASDVCDAAMFLASDRSLYISGTVIPLDGGLAARRTL
jgi:NAD(P)-dependent dehydrogenase (short-subunit alcohol dehydrogenase family)